MSRLLPVLAALALAAAAAHNQEVCAQDECLMDDAAISLLQTKVGINVTGLDEENNNLVVPYKNEGGVELKLTFFPLPPSGKPPNGWPVVLFIHGGGWFFGDEQANQAQDVINNLGGDSQQLDMAIVSVQYRLTTQGHWPAQIEDVFDAVKYLKANAQLHKLDATKMACWGKSAGAHLCSMLATAGSRCKSTRVQAAVAFYPPTNIMTLKADGLWRYSHDASSRGDWDKTAKMELGKDSWAWMPAVIGGISGLQELRTHRNSGGVWQQRKRAVIDMNPGAHVGPQSAPLFLAHGTDDMVVPPGQSDRLAFSYAWNGNGAKIWTWCVQGGGHGGDLWQPAHTKAWDFIRAMFDGESFPRHGTSLPQCTCTCGSNPNLAIICQPEGGSTAGCRDKKRQDIGGYTRGHKLCH